MANKANSDSDYATNTVKLFILDWVCVRICPICPLYFHGRPYRQRPQGETPTWETPSWVSAHGNPKIILVHWFAIHGEAIRKPSLRRFLKTRGFGWDKSLCQDHTARSAVCRDVRLVYDRQVSRGDGLKKNYTSRNTQSQTPIDLTVHVLKCKASVCCVWECRQTWRQHTRTAMNPLLWDPWPLCTGTLVTVCR